MAHMFGYPVKLTLTVEDGAELDVTAAIKPTAAGSVEIDTGTVLDLVNEHQVRHYPRRPLAVDARHNASGDLHVTFTFHKGDVWVDPEGTAWYLKHNGLDGVTFERTVVETVDAKAAARTWRKMGDQ